MPMWKAYNSKRKKDFSEKVMEAKGNTEQLYSTINGLIDQLKDNPLPNVLDDKLANEFLDFFYEKIQKIQRHLEQFPDYQPKMRNVSKMSKFKPVRKIDTLRIMQWLSLKQCKLDTSPTKLLLSHKEDIVDAITDLINSSFEQAHFPKNWKYTIIKPLIKKVNGEIVKTNFRPVSNLKHLSKILECAALFQIMKHSEDNCLQPDVQSAYRSGYTCETILIKLADKVLNGMEMKQLSMIIAMDLSTAFDTVNHKILLKTFWNHYGICDNVLDWISSYLSPRLCSVTINNHCSDLKQLDVSVPQGSCSGAYFS